MMLSRLKKLYFIGLLAPLVFPIFFTPFTSFSWHFGKTMLFQILVEAWLAVSLWYFLNYHPSRRALWLRQVNWLDGLVLLFLVVLSLTALTGVNAGNSWWGNQARANGVFTWWHFGAWYFMLKAALAASGEASNQPKAGGLEQEQSKGWIWLIAIIPAAGAALTVLYPSLLPFVWQSGSGGGIIGNRAFAAMYLLLAFGLSMYAACRQSGWRRYVFALGAIVMLLGMYATRNRAVIVGMAGGLCAAFVFGLFVWRSRRAKILAAVSLALIAGATVAFIRIPALARTLPAWESFASWRQLATEGSGAARLMAWSAAWQGFVARPLLGWGWGNYEVIFSRYYNPQFLRFGFSETVWDKPHNFLLEIADSAGFLGVAVYAAIFGAAVWYLVAAAVGRARARRFGAGEIVLAGTLAAYFIGNLFLFETTNSLILWFFILAWISSRYASPLASAGTSAPLAPATLAPARFGWLKYPAATAVLLVAWKFSILPIYSSYWLSRAQASITSSAWADAAQKTLAVPAPFRGESAIFLAERFIQLDKGGAAVTDPGVVAQAERAAEALKAEFNRYPNNPALPAWEGQIYMVLGEKVNARYYAEAERALLLAQRLSPNKQDFLFLLGRLYLLKKDFASATLYQTKAVAAARGIAISHWFLGLSYVASGDTAKGLSHIEDAMQKGYSLTADQKVYIIDLYVGEKNYSKVIAWYQKLVSEEPDNINWYIRLATAYALAGDKPHALETVRQAVMMYPPLKSEADKFIKEYHLDKP